MYIENFRTTEYYLERLEIILPLIAEHLANGEHLEIAPSRSGLKMYSNNKRHIVLQGMKEGKGGVQSGS